ncbi:MAG: hypothetical protein WBG86_00255, partial [Polyangiales bacterium]
MFTRIQLLFLGCSLCLAGACGDDTTGGGGTAGTGGTGGADGEPSLSFFVTSVGSGEIGGNLGGLAGADEFCRSLAAAVGA